MGINGTTKKLNKSIASTKTVMSTNALSFPAAKRTREEKTLSTGVARRTITPSCITLKGFK